MVNENYTTIRCVFAVDRTSQHTQKGYGVQHYTFKCLKAFALELTVGDHVICVKLNGDLRVVKVVEIDDFAENLLDTQQYSFVFQKVDEELVKQFINHENALVDKLLSAQRRQSQQQVLTALNLSADDLKLVTTNSPITEVK